jgi:cell wall-associated NlpC family hydrolase
MSLEATLSRIAQLQSLLAPPQPVATAPPPATATAFASALQGATATTAAAPVAAGGAAGQAIVAAARGEVGQVEQPPGSNDSPRIAQYRKATAGSAVGPWCAYFVSWAARQAGVPIGDSGQGFGLVDDVMAWGQRTGKALPAGAKPQPGDLIIWDEHMGIVEEVTPDGKIRTIEGNSSDSVARREYGADGGGAVGYVRLG